MSELIQKLRNDVQWYRREYVHEVASEAADLIEELEAKVKRLEEKLDTAPHSEDCPVRNPGRWQTMDGEVLTDCDCWKSEADDE